MAHITEHHFGNVKRTELYDEFNQALGTFEAKGEAEKALADKVRETMTQLDSKISAEGSQINGYNEFHLVISSIYEAL